MTDLRRRFDDLDSIPVPSHLWLEAVRRASNPALAAEPRRSRRVLATAIGFAAVIVIGLLTFFALGSRPDEAVDEPTSVATTVPVVPTSEAGDTTIPAGMIELPDTTGMPWEAALETLESQSVLVGIGQFELAPVDTSDLAAPLTDLDPAELAGRVARQDPPGGTVVRTGTRVVLIPYGMPFAEGAAPTGSVTIHLRGTCVQDITADLAGRVWVACEGLYRWNGVEFEPIIDPPDGIRRVAVADDGTVVVAASLVDGTPALLALSPAGDWSTVETGSVGDLASDGTVWAAMGDHLLHYADGAWSTIDVSGSRVAIGPEGDIWTAGPYAPLLRWDGDQIHDVAGTGATGIAPTGWSEHGLWTLGVPGDIPEAKDTALGLFEGGTWQVIDIGLRPIDLAVGSGATWIATFHGGLLVGTDVSPTEPFTSFAWSRITVDDWLPTDEVTSVTVDPSGTVWIGTGDGVVEFHPSSDPATIINS